MRGKAARSWSRFLAIAPGALVCASCIVPPPPEIEEPTSTALYVHTMRTVPPTHEVLVLDNTSGVLPQMSVWIQSEDLGEKVAGAFHADFGFEGASALQETTIPAGAWADGPRELTVCGPEESEQANCPLRRLVAGCRQITLFLAHESHFRDTPRDGTVLPQFRDQSAAVVWWVNIGNSSIEGWPDALSNCPRPEASDGQ